MSFFQRLILTKEDIESVSASVVLLVLDQASIPSVHISRTPEERNLTIELQQALRTTEPGDCRSLCTRLHSKQIVLAHCPTWKDGYREEDIQLQHCVQRGLSILLTRLVENDCHDHNQMISVALYGTGFPLARAVRVVIGELGDFLAGHDDVHTYLLCDGADGPLNEMEVFREEKARQCKLWQIVTEDALSSSMKLPMTNGTLPTWAVKTHLGDITKMQSDIIVNAANATLRGGGGVDGAIHRAAGPGLLRECIQIGGCETGGVVVTAGYNLAAKYVIHAVGPVWRGGNDDEEKMLGGCYMKALEMAMECGGKVIAFPAISCGAYRFPVEKAVEIAVGCVEVFRRITRSTLQVVFVCFEMGMLDLYEEELFRRRV